MDWSTTYASIDRVSYLLCVHGEQQISVDTDTHLLWVIRDADDWHPTLDVAEGVSCTLSVIVLGTSRSSMTLDVCLSAASTASVSLLACVVDGGAILVDAAMRLQPGAQQSAGYLDTRTMLLGDDVSVRMTP